MNSELKKYYDSKKALIESSISCLFPPTCTNEWVKSITGRDDRPWDTNTLQGAFLDPIHQTLQKKKTLNNALGMVLFLESSGIHAEKYLPLLGISESFDVCLQLLRDISIHESHDRHVHEELKLDDSIRANVGVALLTLPCYPVLHNHCQLNSNIRLWLLQRITTLLSRVFYAIGTGHYRKKKKLLFMNENEYKQHAYYLNGPKIHLNLDLWLALSDHYKSPEATTTAEEFIRSFSLSYKLDKDLVTFKRWTQENKNHTDAAKAFMNNYTLLHINQFYGSNGLLDKSIPTKELVTMFTQAGTEKQMTGLIGENTLAMQCGVDKLPFLESQKAKIKSYVHHLLKDVKYED